MNRETDKRWLVTITYRTENGIVDVEHFIEEISEADELVEAGPSWDTIEEIKIVLNRSNYSDLTVEEAEKL